MSGFYIKKTIENQGGLKNKRLVLHVKLPENGIHDTQAQRVNMSGENMIEFVIQEGLKRDRCDRNSRKAPESLEK